MGGRWGGRGDVFAQEFGMNRGALFHQQSLTLLQHSCACCVFSTSNFIRSLIGGVMHTAVGVLHRVILHGGSTENICRR